MGLGESRAGVAIGVAAQSNQQAGGQAPNCTSGWALLRQAHSRPGGRAQLSIKPGVRLQAGSPSVLIIAPFLALLCIWRSREC